MIKYEMLEDQYIISDGIKLYRIKALISFGNVKEGDVGGYIATEKNLSHSGNAWVYGNACVYGNTQIHGNALVYGDAHVSGNAQMYGDARGSGNTQASV